ncbi:MAG: hypothetical protein GY811_20865 [Myxococcales bacterium]|nr:hypothetical protein [Myxococcales bacterium]
MNEEFVGTSDDMNNAAIGKKGPQELSGFVLGGLVTVGYGGACPWVGDPDMDGDLETLLLGASVEFRTGFTGERAE